MLSRYDDKRGIPESNSNTGAETKDDNLKGPRYPHSDSILTFRKPLIVCAHIVVFAVSLMLSFLVMSSMDFTPSDVPVEKSWVMEQYPILLLLFISVKLLIFGLFKQYRVWWRNVGVSHLVGILLLTLASFVSTLIIVLIWFIWVSKNFPNVADVSEGVFKADFLFTVLILGALRIIIRMIMNFNR
jgi:FlaA1/EpsC-like NDP-sugar epimerase